MLQGYVRVLLDYKDPLFKGDDHPQYKEFRPWYIEYITGEVFSSGRQMRLHLVIALYHLRHSLISANRSHTKKTWHNGKPPLICVCKTWKFDKQSG